MQVTTGKLVRTLKQDAHTFFYVLFAATCARTTSDQGGLSCKFSAVHVRVRVSRRAAVVTVPEGASMGDRRVPIVAVRGANNASTVTARAQKTSSPMTLGT